MKHLCVVTKETKEQETIIDTLTMIGKFKTDMSLRNEFFLLIKS